MSFDGAGRMHLIFKTEAYRESTKILLQTYVATQWVSLSQRDTH